MRGGPSSQRWPKAQITRRQAKQGLALLLTGCTDERLAGFTAAGLSGWYKVPVAECERMLGEARARRKCAQ